MGRVDSARRRRLAAARCHREARGGDIERRSGRLRRAALLRLRSRVVFRHARALDARWPRSPSLLLRRAPDLFARRCACEPLPAAHARGHAPSAARTAWPRRVGGVLPPPQLLPGRRAHDQDVSLSAAARVLDLGKPMTRFWICVVLVWLIPTLALAQGAQP